MAIQPTEAQHLELILEIIESALQQGQKTLSESESKAVLKFYGIPVTREKEVTDHQELIAAVREIGFPLVMKACGNALLHKTEKGLVRLDIRSEAEAAEAFSALFAGKHTAGFTVLVQEMIKGERELVMGFVRDAQFGPCVMFGLGGIFTEIIKDVSFRTVPLSEAEAKDMIREIKATKILGEIRGMPPVDHEQLTNILVTLGNIGLENTCIDEIDINPLIVTGNGVVAVDAMIVLNVNENR
jgi:acetate---CoA ligase (ADP-forming) subunit beta